MIPKRIFFTGAPGSRWSAVAQTLQNNPIFNTSDRSSDRTYSHHKYSGHQGAYYGNGIEFPVTLDYEILDSAFSDPFGIYLYKSHEWVYYIESIQRQYPNAWIMFVYRPTDKCFKWWHEAGGFDIAYPDYSYYQNSFTMRKEIEAMNGTMWEAAIEYGLVWEPFTEEWQRKMFNQSSPVDDKLYDVLVTTLGSL